MWETLVWPRGLVLSASGTWMAASSGICAWRENCQRALKVFGALWLLCSLPVQIKENVIFRLDRQKDWSWDLPARAPTYLVPCEEGWLGLALGFDWHANGTAARVHWKLPRNALVNDNGVCWVLTPDSWSTKKRGKKLLFKESTGSLRRDKWW